eukprot:TRINITY_DN47341_c0_g1_i1.p3 TRINITY_DN47341_c0_g1~~TRINITY_DN47341_c0_g1_i1.p3  ORF type:complete len:154 (+),score=53.75 TRINITY_DN47341_c0_g1_i1:59-463(+)
MDPPVPAAQALERWRSQIRQFPAARKPVLSETAAEHPFGWASTGTAGPGANAAYTDTTACLERCSIDVLRKEYEDLGGGGTVRREDAAEWLRRRQEDLQLPRCSGAVDVLYSDGGAKAVSFDAFSASAHRIAAQ